MEYPLALTESSFSGIFGSPLSPQTKALIRTLNFNYRVLGGKERDDAFLRVVKALRSDLKVSGPHRKEDWEKGWGENLEGFSRTGDLDELLPKFVKQKELIRFNGEYIESEEGNFETRFVKVMRAHLFEKYFAGAKNIYEFGFGAGLNMVAVSKMFPGKKLYGLDWAQASKQIADKLKERGTDITGSVFDMFAPDKDIRIGENSAVFTIGTMEQLGKNFRAFTEYLIGQKPEICINIETVYELYDQDVLFDYVAASYLEKRNYLQGYLDFLRLLGKEGKVEILEARRTFGSFFHDGYTYIVWRPR